MPRRRVKRLRLHTTSGRRAERYAVGVMGCRRLCRRLCRCRRRCRRRCRCGVGVVWVWCGSAHAAHPPRPSRPPPATAHANPSSADSHQFAKPSTATKPTQSPTRRRTLVTHLLAVGRCVQIERQVLFVKMKESMVSNRDHTIHATSHASRAEFGPHRCTHRAALPGPLSTPYTPHHALLATPWPAGETGHDER